MKFTELQDNLESLQTDLLIIYEIANAVEVSLSTEILTAKNVGWALIGIIRNLDGVVKEIENLIETTIKMGSKLKEI